LLLGVVAFDVLPELFELTREHDIDPMGPMAALVTGFPGFHASESSCSSTMRRRART
jgi:hypothetical protein